METENLPENKIIDISNNDMFKMLSEQFHKLKLLQKGDKIVSETEPAWNISEVKLLIDSMMSDLNIMLGSIDESHVNYFRILGMKCAVIYEEAKILINIGDEPQALKSFAKALELLDEHAVKSELTFLSLRVANHYSYIMTKQEDLLKPQTLLEHAQEIYVNVKGTQTNANFYTADDLFFPEAILTPKKETIEKVERLVTNNFQMLAFIYNKQGHYDHFAALHHIVLHRQLEMREGDPAVWAMKAARLAAYFLSKSRFREARHHLAAATHVLEMYETELKGLESSELVTARWDELQRRFADVAKCWVKYGLFLFSVSKTQLMSLFYGEPNEFLNNLWIPPSFDAYHLVDHSDDGTESKEHDSNWGKEEVNTENTDEQATTEQSPDKNEQESEQSEQPPSTTPDNFHILFAKKTTSTSETKDTESNDGTQDGEGQENHSNEQAGQEIRELIFPGVDVSGIECQVTASLVETTEQARRLFLFTHAWLKRSKMFYNLQDHSMEYVNSILDLSELYRYLAFYEEDIESQYSVQKRRADALETLSAVLREARPQCYYAVSVELLRELAEVQMEMLGLNLRRLYVTRTDAEEVAEGEQQKLEETNSTLKPQDQQPFIREANCVLHKMEALADIHAKLEQFGDNLSQGLTTRDGLSCVGPASELTGVADQYFI